MHFIIKELNEQFNKNFTSASSEVMNTLLKYQWPGNIRELRNVLEKAVLLGDGNEIAPKHLPDELKDTSLTPEKVTSQGVTTLEEMEKLQIYNALRKSNWNQTKAAESLGIHRNTLREKIKKFDIRIPSND